MEGLTTVTTTTTTTTTTSASSSSGSGAARNGNERRRGGGETIGAEEIAAFDTGPRAAAAASSSAIPFPPAGAIDADEGALAAKLEDGENVDEAKEKAAALNLALLLVGNLQRVWSGFGGNWLIASLLCLIAC